MFLNEIFTEAMHTYDSFEWDTKFQPVKTGDTFRVYHGFRDFSHAVSIARQGMSGKERANRVYSYEFDNNPNGLFVTLSFKVADEFVGSYDEQCIMEFVVRLDELEPPVWPGGSYTVQGQMAQFFGHGAKGRSLRRQRGRDAERETIDQFAGRQDFEHINQSDQKYLASLLTASREHQALFVGDLSPDRISAFHVRPKGSRRDVPWERLNREEFLQRYAEEKAEDREHNRMLGPADDFDGELFLQRLNKEVGGGKRDLDDNIKHLFQDALTSQHPTQAFMQSFGRYLWPRQYKAAFWWMRKRYGKPIATVE